MREAVEAQSARLCAERAGTAVLQALSDVLKAQASAVKRNDAQGWFETNADFHRFVAEGAGNRRLLEVVLQLEGQMRLGLRQVSSDRTQRVRGLTEHRAILDAIGRHDPETAEPLMREHLRRTRDTLAAQGTSVP